jgi:uncharacterized protein (TIGR02453 family)
MMADMQFSRFPAETLTFLRGIADNNSRDWFEANRALYEAGYVEPARRFVEAVGPRLARISQNVRYEPKVNGSISRINRDIRFSRDKRPYKDHLDIWFWHGDKKGWDRPGFYVRIAPETIFIGSGMHVLKDEMLERFRLAALDVRSGRELAEVAASVAAAGYEIGGATRKSVPRGYDGAHEHARFLLHEGLYAGKELPAEEATSPGFAERALAHFAATWPVGRWLLEKVAQ